MGASFSSTLTSYSQRLLNSTSFNNSTASELIELSSTVDPTPPTSGIPHAPTAAISTDSAAGDTRAQDNLKPILIAGAAAILAGSFTLLTNPPKPVQNVVLYNIYSLFLLLSFVLCIGFLLLILSTTPNHQLGGTGTGTAWVRMKALQIAGVSLVGSVILRIFLQLSAHIRWYEVLVPVLVLGGISICLLIGWIMTTDSAQVSSSVLASSDEAV